MVPATHTVGFIFFFFSAASATPAAIASAIFSAVLTIGMQCQATLSLIAPIVLNNENLLDFFVLLWKFDVSFEEMTLLLLLPLDPS